MNRPHLSPHWYVLSTIFTILFCLVLFHFTGHHDRYFFLAIFLLAFLWGASFFIAQLRGRSSYHVDRQQSLLHLLRRALPRYGIWLALFSLALWLYGAHSYYRLNDKTLLFLHEFFNYFVLFGIPYFILTLKYKASRIEDFYDPALRIIVMLRSMLPISWTHRRYTFARAWRRTSHRKIWLNLIMRAYFIPVMVSQVFIGLRDSMLLLPHTEPGGNVFSFIAWITAVLWLMDALSASVGYAIESRWLENRSRSIDMTLGGWLVCLYCYPPLNQVTGTVFPFGPLVASSDPSQMLIPSMTLLLSVQIIALSLLVALIYCDLSLGPSGVNITFKKLQDRGPYGIVRHPATVCKLAFWWIQSICFVPFWTWEIFLGHMMWNVIYILRALSEERHLSTFEEYREYKQRVPYRFIPGLI